MAKVQIRIPDKIIYSRKMEVRSGDISGALHLGNHILVSYLNDTLYLFLRENGVAEPYIDGATFINSDLAVVYKSESFLGNQLRIDLSVGRLGKYGCDLFFKITNETTGKKAAVAKMGMLFFNYNHKKPTAMTEAFKSFLKPK